MSEQEWHDIPGHPGFKISRKGLVKSDPYVCMSRGRPKRIKEMIRTPWRDVRGYAYVFILGKPRIFHRLLALTFIPNPLGLPQVNHKNGIKSDNRLENLEWCTLSDNCLHRCRVLGKSRGTGSGMAKLNEDLVRQLRVRFMMGETSRSIAKSMGLNKSTVLDVANRFTWAHVA